MLSDAPPTRIVAPLNGPWRAILDVGLSPLSINPMKRILSIDGGGIRGLIPALVLQHIEEETDRSIATLFDLIAGTSTGGILALGLSCPKEGGGPKYSADELADLYLDHGPDIFDQSVWRRITTLFGLRKYKYSHDALEAVLEDHFEYTPLGQAEVDVLVSAYGLQNREPIFFKSWRSEHKHVEMRHIGRATSAAPTFFEPALVTIQGSQHALVDGGVFVNSPAMSAYAEARRRWPDEEIHVVSLGTGALTRPYAYKATREWGLLKWVVSLLDIVFDGVSDAVDYQLKHLLQDNFQRFQVPLRIASDDMDDASPQNLDRLESEAHRLMDVYGEELDALCDQLIARSVA